MRKLREEKKKIKERAAAVEEEMKEYEKRLTELKACREKIDEENHQVIYAKLLFEVVLFC